jgi:tRNA(Leu) C34 or U34 (ribose-2'-O)-methylase TrmL
VYDSGEEACMNPRWRRWRGYVDEIEDLLRVHGDALARADADLREQYERGTWPQGQERAAGPEIVRRALGIPFLRRLILDARAATAEELDTPRDGGFVPWSGTERRRSRPSARRSEASSPEPGDDGAPPSHPPERLVNAERALARRTRSLVVVLEEPTNPRNAAAVARSVEFFGLQELHVITAAGRTPLQVSVARSCDRYLDLFWYRDAETALSGLRDRDYRIVVADHAEGSAPIGEVELGGRVALVVGNEQLGVSPAMREAADALCFIPAAGMGAYLNLSTATAIAVYELGRRMQALGLRAPLEASDARELRRTWYDYLGAGNADRVRAYRRWAAHPPRPDEPASGPPSREKRRERER